jgi:hypothetical protein
MTIPLALSESLNTYSVRVETSNETFCSNHGTPPSDVTPLTRELSVCPTKNAGA